MLKNTKKAEHALIKKLASIYKVSTDLIEVERLKSNTDEELPFIQVTTPDSVNSIFYCAELTGKSLSLMSLIDPVKFSKSEINDTRKNIDLYGIRGDVYLAVYITGTVWVVYENVMQYNGIIVTVDLDKRVDIGIQPLHLFAQAMLHPPLYNH